MTTPQVKNEQELNVESVTWGNLTWISIVPPTEKEIEYLAQNYPFHRLDLDDCLSRKQRPKLDVYKDYLFFVLHFPIWRKETRVATHSQVSVFIGENYLITLHTGEIKPLVKLFRQCQIDEEQLRENLSYGSGYLLYRILDRAVDAYFPVLDKILSLMEDIEDRVFDEKVEAAQELAILRRDIIMQRRIIFPMRTVIAEMEGKLKRFTNTDMTPYFGDLLDHINKQCETLDECKEVIEVFKDADYVLGTDRINQIMRVLTIISAIMLPLIVISSLWSMNVPTPFGANPGGSPYVFVAMVVVSIGVAGGMLYFFRRKHWI
jgi:magnesium transporter